MPTTSYRSTRLQSGFRARILSKSSRIASKLLAFSSRYIGKNRPEEIKLPKQDSPDRNSKTKKYLKILNRTKNVLTILKIIYLRNVIFSTNSYTLKVRRSKENMLKVSSKL